VSKFVVVVVASEGSTLKMG